MTKGSQAEKDHLFFAVSPMTIFPDTRGDFRVYLRSGGEYVLYTKEMECFTDGHKKRLGEHGVDEVFIPTGQRDGYTHYVEKHIGGYLNNKKVPLDVRSEAFYDASQTLVRDVFDKKLPDSVRMSKGQFNRITRFVKQSLDFVSSEKSFEKISKLISSDYQLYSHSINAFVFTMCMLNSYGLDEDTMTQAGVGAILHDIGKSDLPPEALVAPEEDLPAKDLARLKSHPARGVAMCTMAAMGQLTLNCILLHHEREDGTGYPSGITGEDIPLPIKVLALADAYDNLTAGRFPEKVLSPYEALRFIREKELGGFDLEVYKRLVLILSGARII